MIPSEPFVLRGVVIDKDVENLALLRGALLNDALEMFFTPDPLEGLKLVQTKRAHIALLDLATPKPHGIDLLEKIVEIDPALDVILMSPQCSNDSAVKAIQRGACDFLPKPISIPDLCRTIEQLIAEARQRRHSLNLEMELLEASQFEGMVGRNPLMLDLFRKIRRLAPHFRTLLITGEPGTGKGLAAKALHRLGPVAAGSFVTCNCSAMMALFESELFGHVQGAFAGATQDQAGIFEQGDGGIVLLDEIGDLPLALQEKILRVLQNQEIQSVGSTKARKVNVRVIAATHRDLGKMVAEKAFRGDLYSLLSRMEVRVPSLSERREDLPLLARHFLHAFSAQSNKQVREITGRGQMLLSRHSWAGNVGELKDVLEQACVSAEGETIDVRDFPEHLRSVRGRPNRRTFLSLEEMQTQYVREVVKQIGNKVKAADLLGIGRTTLYRFLEPKPAKEHAEEPGVSNEKVLTRT
jgi:two-component system, NtrC family, response regulator HydG